MNQRTVKTVLDEFRNSEYVNADPRGSLVLDWGELESRLNYYIETEVKEPQRPATPGEDAWLDELEATVQFGVGREKRRNVMRTILRAYRANLLSQPPDATAKAGGPND